MIGDQSVFVGLFLNSNSLSSGKIVKKREGEQKKNEFIDWHLKFVGKFATIHELT